MVRNVASLGICLAMLGVGCLGASSAGESESEVRAGAELDVALSGHAVDPAPLIGTFDVVPGDGPAPEHGRFIFMRDGSALACAAATASAPDACRPIAAPPAGAPSSPNASVRRPFELHEVLDGRARYVILRTSATDPSLFRVYAVEPTNPSADGWSFREVTRTGTKPASSMRRLPCSETMYEEQDAAHACAFYRCRLEGASFAGQRCSYISDFGLPYCEKYFAVDFRDRSFGPRVRQCLQESIRDKMETMTCGDLEDAAIRSHVDCYVRSGFCALSFSDRLRVKREIEPKDFSLDLVKTFLEIESACGAASGASTGLDSP